MTFSDRSLRDEKQEKPERWQFRAAFNVVGDRDENDQRMRVIVAEFHKAFASEFIDRASIEFVCERIDPPQDVQWGAPSAAPSGVAEGDRQKDAR